MNTDSYVLCVCHVLEPSSLWPWHYIESSAPALIPFKLRMPGPGSGHSRWGQRTLEQGSSIWDVSEAPGQRSVQVVWPISPSMRQACPGRQFQGMSVGLCRRRVIVLVIVCQLGWAEGTWVADTRDPWVCMLETRCDSVTEGRHSFPGQGASANPVGPHETKGGGRDKECAVFSCSGTPAPWFWGPQMQTYTRGAQETPG